MGFVQGLLKRLPSTPAVPSLDDLKNEKSRTLPRLSFFKRRIRLKGNSSISIPLGFVLLFPSIVVLLILILVVKHPSSPGRILVPAGTPPTIRYVVQSSWTMPVLTLLEQQNQRETRPSICNWVSEPRRSGETTSRQCRVCGSSAKQRIRGRNSIYQEH